MKNNKIIDNLIKEATDNIKEETFNLERYKDAKKNPSKYAIGSGSYGDRFLILEVGDHISTKHMDSGIITKIHKDIDGFDAVSFRNEETNQEQVCCITKIN